MSHGMLGNEWWQWAPHGSSRDEEYRIHVVVYHNISLETVKQRYPVDPNKNMDYRYVAYSSAIAYLDKNIDDLQRPISDSKVENGKGVDEDAEWRSQLIEKLKTTRQTIGSRAGA